MAPVSFLPKISSAYYGAGGRAVAVFSGTTMQSGRTRLCGGGRPWLAYSSSVNNVLVNNSL